jgi:hypothetical protein
MYETSPTRGAPVPPVEHLHTTLLACGRLGSINIGFLVSAPDADVLHSAHFRSPCTLPRVSSLVAVTKSECGVYFYSRVNWVSLQSFGTLGSVEGPE